MFLRVFSVCQCLTSKTRTGSTCKRALYPAIHCQQLKLMVSLFLSFSLSLHATITRRKNIVNLLCDCTKLCPSSYPIINTNSCLCEGLPNYLVSGVIAMQRHTTKTNLKTLIDRQRRRNRLPLPRIPIPIMFPLPLSQPFTWRRPATRNHSRIRPDNRGTRFRCPVSRAKRRAPIGWSSAPCRSHSPGRLSSPRCHC